MLLKYNTLKHRLAASNGLRAAGVARQRGVLLRRMSAHSTVSSQQGGCAISECKAVTIQWRCALYKSVSTMHQNVLCGGSLSFVT